MIIELFIEEACISWRLKIVIHTVTSKNFSYPLSYE